MSKKKYNIHLLSALIFSYFFSACAANISTPVMGVLSTNVKGPITFTPGSSIDNASYEVLGVVEGHATASTTLGIIATGDASIAKALDRALKKIPNADAIINMTIDYKSRSFFGLVASYTTIIRGTAVRYTSPKSSNSKHLITSKQAVVQSFTKPENKNEHDDVGALKVDLETFKADVKQALKNAYITRKFYSWAKNNGKPTNKNEWVNTLTKKDYISYKSSQATIKEWLLNYVFIQ